MADADLLLTPLGNKVVGTLEEYGITATGEEVKTYLSKPEKKSIRDAIVKRLGELKGNEIPDAALFAEPFEPVIRHLAKKQLPEGFSSEMKANMLYDAQFPMPNNMYTIGTKQYLDLHKQFSTRQNQYDTEAQTWAKCRNDVSIVGIARGKGVEKADRRYAQAFLVAVVGTLVYCVYLSVSTLGTNEAARAFDETDPDSVKIKRQQSRGTVASILVSLSFGLINFLVDYFGNVDPATSTALVGMTYGGTLGFLMDNALASDSGWALCRTQSPLSAWKYALGAMATGRYIRYGVTVLLDLFISLILFKPLYSSINSLPFFRCGKSAIANGLSSTIIGLLTFQAYANVTRFTWAYPTTDSQTNRNWIRGGTMQVLVSIAAIVFLISNTQVNPGERGINMPKVKLYVALGAMAVVWGLCKFDEMQPVLDLDVVPDNIFIVTSPSRDMAEGDEVIGSALTDVDTSSALDIEQGVKVVVLKKFEREGEETRYKVRRKVPASKYKVSDNISPSEIKASSWKGSLAIVLLGAIVSFGTIWCTSKKPKGKKVRMIAGFMLMSVLVAIPGIPGVVG